MSGSWCVGLGACEDLTGVLKREERREKRVQKREGESARDRERREKRSRREKKAAKAKQNTGTEVRHRPPANSFRNTATRNKRHTHATHNLPTESPRNSRARDPASKNTRASARSHPSEHALQRTHIASDTEEYPCTSPILSNAQPSHSPETLSLSASPRTVAAAKGACVSQSKANPLIANLFLRSVGSF